MIVGADPRAVEDDGHLRHLRRAHRQRPALQEGRAARPGPRHPPQGVRQRSARQGAVPHLRRGRRAQAGPQGEVTDTVYQDDRKTQGN